MKERTISAALLDIAHRWFAYFEGDTEILSDHLTIFSDDIKLVHAGTHLLAKDHHSLMTWFNSIPEEKASHFITEFDWYELGNDNFAVVMSVSYHVIHEDGTKGGAIIEYETRAKLTSNKDALFTAISKTPVMANPFTVFQESFTANRIGSTLAHLVVMLDTHQSSELNTLASYQHVQDQLSALVSHYSAEILAESIVNSMTRDHTKMCTTLHLPKDETAILHFQDNKHRYLAISQIDCSFI